MCFGGWKGKWGQHFTSFHEFWYTETPQDKHCSVFHLADSQTKLHVLDFHVAGAELELPLTALLALSCIASISTLYFYAKSLSCILNTPLDPARLTAVTEFTPALTQSPPRGHPTVPASLLASLVTSSEGSAVPLAEQCAIPAPWMCFWAGRSAAREESLLMRRRPLSSPRPLWIPGETHLYSLDV